MDVTAQLADQLDFHWRSQLRPRLDGLTDDEYFWEPVKDCWTVHRDGSIDFLFPPPQPEPFTTIAWRMAHVIVGARAQDGPALAAPSGPHEGPYAEPPMSELVLHINREVIHQGAEIACLRDLYAHSHYRTGESNARTCLARYRRTRRAA
jgi:hypothetical protein